MSGSKDPCAFTAQQVRHVINLDYRYIARNADGGVYVLTATANTFVRPVRWGVFFFTPAFIKDLDRAAEALPSLMEEANADFIGFWTTGYVISEYRAELSVRWEILRRKDKRCAQLPVIVELMRADHLETDEPVIRIVNSGRMAENVDTQKIGVRELLHILEKGQNGDTTPSDQCERELAKGKKP